MTFTFEFAMPYIGHVLSVNHCYYPRGHRIRREVRMWMRDLAGMASCVPPPCRTPPVIIGLRGVFRDGRSTPDLANLHKVIGDAVAKGLGMNDVDFRFRDEGYSLDKKAAPQLTITITTGSEEDQAPELTSESAFGPGFIDFV